MFASRLYDIRPESVEEIRHLKEVFHDSIVSIIKYGFGKRNILVVVNDTSVDYLAKIRPYLKKLSKNKNIIILSKKNIYTKNIGIDFLNIKLTSVIIYGEDVLHDLKFDKESLRNQIVYEANKILINIRHEYLSKTWSWQRKNIIFHAIPRILPIIVAHMYLEDQKIPNAIPDTINRYLKINEDAAVLMKISRSITSAEVNPIFNELFIFLENLSEKV